jgi:hypothetical protein
MKLTKKVKRSNIKNGGKTEKMLEKTGKDGVGTSTRFSSTNQPENRGRKKELFRGYIEENDLSLADVKNTIKNMIAAKTLDELREDVKSGQYSALITGFIMAYIKSCTKGNPSFLAWLTEVLFGKQVQPIRHEGDMKVTIKPAPKALPVPDENDSK